MLSPHLPELLRAWYKAARPQGWLFPGQDRVNSLSTGQLNRACHAAAHMAETHQTRIAPYLGAQLRDTSRAEPSKQAI